MTQLFFGILLIILGSAIMTLGIVKSLDKSHNESLPASEIIENEEALGYYGIWGVATLTIVLETSKRTIIEVYPREFKNEKITEEYKLMKAEMTAKKYDIPLSQNWNTDLNGI